MLGGQTTNPMDEKDLVQALTEVIKDDEKQIEELKQRLEFVTERRERNKNLLNSIKNRRITQSKWWRGIMDRKPPIKAKSKFKLQNKPKYY